MKKVMRIFWLVVLAAVVIGTFVYLWTKSRPKEVSYEIVSPSIETITKKAVATGKIEPRNEVLIKPQISGIISKIYKEAGEKVHGQTSPEGWQVVGTRSRHRLCILC